MVRFLFLITILLNISMVSLAQTEKRIYTKSEQESAQTRELQKRMETIQDSINYVNALNALQNLDFVLEADRLIFKRGHIVFVTSNTNFISLSDDKAVVQVAPFYGGGPNGIGGITLDGKASNIKLKTDKKGNILFSMNVSGAGISATVEVSLIKGNNRASVSVNPNFHSNRITLDGYLIPTAFSSVYKGQSF